MLLTPPSFTLILRQRLERVWGVVLLTFFDCTHWVASPNIMSPTRFTSAVNNKFSFFIHEDEHWVSNLYMRRFYQYFFFFIKSYIFTTAGNILHLSIHYHDSYNTLPLMDERNYSIIIHRIMLYWDSVLKKRKLNIFHI